MLLLRCGPLAQWKLATTNSKRIQRDNYKNISLIQYLQICEEGEQDTKYNELMYLGYVGVE